MDSLAFSFSKESFSKLFPFFILIDKQLIIKDFGESISIVCPFIKKETVFNVCFDIKLPNPENITFDDLLLHCNQLILIECKKSKVSLRGQFQIIKNALVFLGTPQFASIKKMNAKKLTFSNFALHDPSFNLLHLIDNQENDSKELKGIVTTIRGQKKNLKKDKEELNKLALVASTNQNGIIFSDIQGKIIWVNEAYLKLTGFAKEEVIGKNPIHIGKTTSTELDDLQKMTNSFFKGESFEVELHHGCKDGSSFWSRIKGQPILNSKQEVIEYFAMIEDISLKKQFEESLKSEKEKYSNIIANMNLGLLEVDKKGSITLANQSFSNISGYGIDELIGKNAVDLLATEETEEIIKKRTLDREKGVTDSYEVKVINKKGIKRNWLISGAPNYSSTGEWIGSIGIHLDITEQKEQAEKLYLLSLIAEKNLNAVIIADTEGRIEWANKSFIEMSGYTIEEVVGKKPGHLLQGKETNLETVNYIRESISKGLPFNCEIINYSKQGKKYWVNIQGQALYNNKGEISKFFAIEENITEKKEFEEKQAFLVKSLAKSNKELEDYASIVSHDLKSPLRSIHSLVSWVKEDNDKQLSEETMQYLSLIEGKVEKMDYLIEGILTYSKIDKVDVLSENVSIQEIIESIIHIIHIPSHIKVTISGKLPVLKANRFRMQQLFQNLISNAVNYIDKPLGTVAISCVEEEANYIFAIKDNGMGIAKENQERIFKTFQSLKQTDKSTGLGLSIVKKIVESYEGKIWIESELTIGTTFYIALKK